MSSPATSSSSTAPSSVWTILNHAGNKTAEGFWGSTDATHAFCEPHYEVSWYTAEFYNAWSSLVFCIMSLYLARAQKFRGDPYCNFANVILFVIGTGSFLFHAMMKYWTQLLDEIPMVVFAVTVIVAKIRAPKRRRASSFLWISQYRNVLSTIVVGTGLAVIYVYMMLGQYELFFHGFSLLCLYDCLSYSFAFQADGNKRSNRLFKQQQRAVMFSAGLLLLGRVAWETENRRCSANPKVWPLHVVWHLLSCLSAYGSMVFTYLSRLDGQSSTSNGSDGKGEDDLPFWPGISDGLLIWSKRDEQKTKQK